MFFGILLVLSGLLILAHPPLLAYIVAFFIILVGLWVMSISWHYKRLQRMTGNPYMDFFIKF